MLQTDRVVLLRGHLKPLTSRSTARATLERSLSELADLKVHQLINTMHEH
jgi:hypothetical protein